VIDGEVVALEGAGRPSFSALQNGSATATIVYYVFDVMVGGRNVMGETLATRRDLLTRMAHAGGVSPKEIAMKARMRE
jgi:ATP-dependent DNA ligase